MPFEMFLGEAAEEELRRRNISYEVLLARAAQNAVEEHAKEPLASLLAVRVEAEAMIHGAHRLLLRAKQLFAIVAVLVPVDVALRIFWR